MNRVIILHQATVNPHTLGSAMMIGQLSLNLSFLTYMFLYLPQVIHNQQQTDLAGLSKRMHVTLYLAYFFDVCYGFGNHLPWQYRAVSLMGWLLLTIQHLQLIHYFKQQKQGWIQVVFYGILLSACTILLFGMQQHTLTNPSYYGYLAQIGFAVAFIPQIIKSQKLRSMQSLSIIYLILGLILALLDCISAWQLDWGWSNKLGSGIILALTSILLLQYIRYQHTAH